MFNLRKKKFLHLVSLFAILLFLSALIPSLRAPLLNTLKYPLKFFTLIKREVGGVIFFHHNLVQVEQLKKETDLLRYNLNSANEINLENRRLKELLSFKEKTPFKVIVTESIGRSPDNWSSVVIVDKGESSGIKSGFVAISYLGLVGRVIETTKSTSKIMLINNPNLSVSSIVQRSRQEGLITGTLGSNLVMKYLPVDSDIKISDVVVTSGLTEMYPKGLLIGTVVGIGEESSGLSRYAIIKPAVDLSGLEEVLIIIPF